MADRSAAKRAFSESAVALRDARRVLPSAKAARLASIAAVESAWDPIPGLKKSLEILSGAVSSVENNWRDQLAAYVDQSGVCNGRAMIQNLMDLPCTENLLPALGQLTKEIESQGDIAIKSGVAAGFSALVPLLWILTINKSEECHYARKEGYRLQGLYNDIVKAHPGWRKQYDTACSRRSEAEKELSNAQSNLRGVLDGLSEPRSRMDQSIGKVLQKLGDFKEAKARLRFSLLGRCGLDGAECNIAMVGEAGVGKSTTVCCILNVDPADERGNLEKPFIYDGADAGTNEAEEFRADSCGVVLWDMPGIGPDQPRAGYSERFLLDRSAFKGLLLVLRLYGPRARAPDSNEAEILRKWLDRRPTRPVAIVVNGASHEIPTIRRQNRGASIAEAMELLREQTKEKLAPIFAGLDGPTPPIYLINADAWVLRDPCTADESRLLGFVMLVSDPTTTLGTINAKLDGRGMPHLASLDDIAEDRSIFLTANESNDEPGTDQDLDWQPPEKLIDELGGQWMTTVGYCNDPAETWTDADAEFERKIVEKAKVALSNGGSKRRGEVGQSGEDEYVEEGASRKRSVQAKSSTPRKRRTLTTGTNSV